MDWMSDRGRRNAIFVLRRLVERVIEKQQGIYVCFIFYNKEFYTEKREPLIELLQFLDIDTQDVKLLLSEPLIELLQFLDIDTQDVKLLLNLY